MKRVLTAVMLIPLVLISVKIGGIAFALPLLLVALLALHETFQIAKSQGYFPFPALSYLATAALFVYWFESPGGISFLAGLGAGLATVASIALIVGLRRAELHSVLPGVSISLFSIVYIAGALGSGLLLQQHPGGWAYIVFILLVVWVGDTAAYYVGRSVGRRKFAPIISPNKTWEGAIASVVGAVVVGTLWMRFLPRLKIDSFRLFGPGLYCDFLNAPLWITMLSAAVINVAAQLGDLAESALKRGAGVKDSGTILPGHGGILDRIDALLFALPVGVLTFEFIRQYFISCGL